MVSCPESGSCVGQSIGSGPGVGTGTGIGISEKVIDPQTHPVPVLSPEQESDIPDQDIVGAPWQDIP